MEYYDSDNNKMLNIDNSSDLAYDNVANVAIAERVQQLNTLADTILKFEQLGRENDVRELKSYLDGSMLAFYETCDNQLKRIREEKQKQRDLDAVANQDYETIINELGITGRIK